MTIKKKPEKSNLYICQNCGVYLDKSKVRLIEETVGYNQVYFTGCPVCNEPIVDKKRGDL